jgi:hypothetical protein
VRPCAGAIATYLARVSRVLLAVAALVLIVVLVLGRDDARDAARAEPVATQPVAPARTTSAAPTAPAARHIKKLTPDERREVEKQIETARAARAQRAATAAPAPPHLPEQGGIESLPPGALDMLKEALPYLADCYEQGSATPASAIAMLTLQGDPDVGTLIDPGAIVDDKQLPIDPEVAGCLATTLQSLELPPLREGDNVKLQFTFRR